MALIVEDGTGLTTAESYVSVDYADAYHLAHHNSEWEGYTFGVKEGSLRYAARFLDGAFIWIGFVLKVDQRLGWPRIMGVQYADLFLEDGRMIKSFPDQIKEAQCEIALVHIKVSPVQTVTAPHSNISSVTAGSVSVTFADPAMPITRSQSWDYIIDLLRFMYRSCLIGTSARNVSLSRG
jgi:hypothetical protein